MYIIGIKMIAAQIHTEYEKRHIHNIRIMCVSVEMGKLELVKHF